MKKTLFIFLAMVAIVASMASVSYAVEWTLCYGTAVNGDALRPYPPIANTTLTVIGKTWTATTNSTGYFTMNGTGDKVAGYYTLTTPTGLCHTFYYNGSDSTNLGTAVFHAE